MSTATSTSEERQIIVVDDDEVNLRLVSSVLAWEKFKIFTASSGQEALEYLNTLDPHLIILDINMPGLNGYETLKKVRERKKYVSVIFLSSNKQTEEIVKGLNAGADDYVVKPFHPTELIARVNVQLRNRDIKTN